MTTEKAFQSLDETLGQIKADHATQIRMVTDQLLAAQMEATMAMKREKEAINGRIEAEKKTAKYQSLFTVLQHVLNEAAALDSMTPSDIRTPVVLNKELIDSTNQTEVK